MRILTAQNKMLHSLKMWINGHRIQSLLIAGALLVVSSGAVVYAVLQQPLPSLNSTPIAIAPRPAEPLYAPLTGLKVKEKADQTKPVNAVIIENSPAARPQSGLKEAEIVYEAVAEGGVTRFLALYQQNAPGLIGPVRSIRPYFLDWAAAYDASIVHVGGSALALRQVKSGGYRDMDQFYNASTFWRTADRYAPHNVYTNAKSIARTNKANKYTQSKPASFLRTESKPSTTLTAKTIRVGISGPDYDSTYRYSTKTSSYTRYQAGALHRDREKGKITPKVVIVLKVSSRTERQETEREVMKTVGSGDAVIFQNGIATKVQWKKTARSTAIEFIDATTRKPFALERGQTWITAIEPNKGTISWK